MDEIPESQATRRLRILARIALVWALVILGKLFYLQVIVHEQIQETAVKQHNWTVKVSSERGRILDRNNQTLAISVPADSVAINPRRTPDLEMAREILCRILNLDSAKLKERMDLAVKQNRGYLLIKRWITPEESRKIRSLKLDWVEITRESKRRYPKGSLAANVLGTVDFQGNGNSGLELSLNEELQGKTGLNSRLTDALRRGIDSEEILAPQAGTNIGISIDERIQYAADSELQKAIKLHDDRTGSSTGNLTGSIVVMDPHNGEILAMSNFPTTDPNARVVTEAHVRARTNQAVSVPYEPGSVFKMITVASALETTSITPSTLIDCGSGIINLLGRRIHDEHPYDIIPVSKVLAKSSNVGAIKIALEIGQEKFLESIRRFGFGQRTGIELPGESPGLIRDLKHWGRTSIGSVAMGHELSTTTLQMALATSVIANGGLLPKPRLILWRQRPGDELREEPMKPQRRVINPVTTIKMKRMMEGVVLDGTGSRARLMGYSSGGKTGTAQIFDIEQRQYTHEYNASYVGFAPVQNPAIVVVVTINGSSEFGGIVAAPVFQKVATEALRILGTIPDVPPETQLPEYELEDEALDDLSIAELALPPTEEMLRTEQPAGEPPMLLAAQISQFVQGPTIPDFQGQSLRRVAAECIRLGVEFEYHGNGVARDQYPPPGTVLPVGERVRVLFAR